ncbi:hypothetical protein ACFYM5_33640 [Streptomyces sp. NPDC006706]|uniref:hypothetical protein n=1 Tax=Streptomyces sp. NPDC006706 TaxID=3364761 RepID=UPI00368A64F8
MQDRASGAQPDLRPDGLRMRHLCRVMLVTRLVPARGIGATRMQDGAVIWCTDPSNTGSTATADVARHLLGDLGRSAGLIEQAWKQTVLAAVSAWLPLKEVARWAG